MHTSRSPAAFGFGSRRSLLLILIAALAFSNTLTEVLAVAGGLDPTFGNGGKVTTDFGSQSDSAGAVVVQQDGKIVAGGSTLINLDFFDTAFALARYNSNGSLDSSFGTGGKVVTNIVPSTDEIDALAIQTDGKIVAAGTVSGGVSVVRYNSDGSLDATFGSGGKVITFIPTGNHFLSLAIQPDGKILIAGGTQHTNSSVFLLLRYNANGSLDSAFGSGGVVTTEFEQGATALALALEASGRIVVGGATSNVVRTAFALARYESNGALVPTFGSSGKVITAIDGYSCNVLTLSLQPDGRILAAGISFNQVSTYSAFLRYNLDGVLDSAFGTAGMLPADSLSSAATVINEMAILSDGHILAVGSTRIFPSDYLVVRYNNNGNFDSSFGSGGKTTIDFDGGNDSCLALALQGDGKVVVAGGAFITNSGFDFALARLEVGPNFDICLQDESNGNLLKINTTTGDYQFTNCAGVTVGGMGSITKRGGLITLQDNAPDRRVLARLDTAARKATASIQLLSTGATFNIIDMNTANNTCVCR